MKLKTKLLIGSALCFCVVSLLLLRIRVKDSIEQIVERALAEPPTRGDILTKKRMSPELEDFLSWYKPLVIDASPEVLAVMKKFDPKYRKGRAHRNEELEQQIPTDEWIQRLLDMGVKFEDYSDYSAYLSARGRIFHAQNDPEALEDLKQRHSLASETSLDEVIRAHINGSVQLHTLTEQAIAMDSRVYGGSLSKEGVFIPKRLKTVYVQPGTIRAGAGVPKWVVYELADREVGLPPKREIPKDVDIIYLDETGQLIKDRVPPSFGDSGETPAFRSSETVGGPVETNSLLADDFDNSFSDDLPPSDTEAYEFEKPKIPPSVAEIEKQLTLQGIEAELNQGLSPEQFDKAQQLIDQYGTEEGLRRLRESDPEAAQQFERERSPKPARDVPDDGQPQ